MTLEELKEHWKKGNRDLETAKEIAKFFGTRTEWRKNHSGSYQKSRIQGWLHQCCEDMKVIRKKWSFQDCKNEAIKYNYRKEWENNHNKTYQFARKKGWIDKCCEHMYRKCGEEWDLKKCKNIALKYKTRIEWRYGHPRSYQVAHFHKWADKCCSHMKTLREDWNKKTCKKISSNYKTISEWQKRHHKSYDFARRKGWINELTSHMKRKGGYNNTEIGVFYILKVTSKIGCKWYKIGITNRSVKDRYKFWENEHFKVIKQETFNNGQVPFEIELNIKRKLKGHEIPKNIFPLESGHSETFKTTKEEILELYNQEKQKLKNIYTFSQLSLNL